MPKYERTARLVIARLERDGWFSVGGARHEKFMHPERPGERVMVPRHRILSLGVAASIAKAAGWN